MRKEGLSETYRAVFMPSNLLGSLHPCASIGGDHGPVKHPDRVLADLESSGKPIGIGSAAGFHEVCQRSPGRFDITTPFSKLPQGAEAEIGGLMERVLGPDYERAFCGVVCSRPGSSDQLWHADSLHMYPEHCPPNLINCLVALHDIPLEMGPTELSPGSHVKTNHYRDEVKQGKDIVYQSPLNTLASIGAEELGTHCTELSRGSVLIFDDRILHRGLANHHTSSRYVGYLSYRRGWFEPSTHFEATKSLYEEGDRKEEVYEDTSFPNIRTADGKHRGQVTQQQFALGNSLADAVRAEFPAVLDAEKAGAVFADGAGGSQVHESVITAVSHQMRYGSANLGGYYPTSELCIQTVRQARERCGALLNCKPSEITFGHNMTSITSHLSHSLKSALSPGDNVVLSRLEHDANAGLWTRMAEETGCEVRWVPVTAPTCQLDMEKLESLVDERTRLVALGYAANSVGTINDVARACRAARNVGAMSFVDAVHYAPHGLVDVRALGCDFLVCSPYKFYGPHAGVLYGREGLMASLPAYKIRTSEDKLPSDETYQISRWELGTANFEALAGVTACVDYIATLGERLGHVHSSAGPISLRSRIERGWGAVGEHETQLKDHFLSSVKHIPGIHVFGLADLEHINQRTSTFAVAKEIKDSSSSSSYSSSSSSSSSSASFASALPPLMDPDLLTRSLTSQGIYCTSGNHYCTFWQDTLGLADADGATRLGFLHYNTVADVDRALEALERA